MTILTTDARGRTTLGVKSATYKVTELDDGAILLEPARVLTEVELKVLATPGMIQDIQTSLDDLKSAQPARRRSHRPADA